MSCKCAECLKWQTKFEEDKKVMQAESEKKLTCDCGSEKLNLGSHSFWCSKNKETES